LTDQQSLQTASFRDPAGSVFFLNDRVFRVVTPAGKQDLEAFLVSPSAREFLDKGRVASTTVLEGPDQRAVLSQEFLRDRFESLDQCIVLEHERIPFPSFPYEWPPLMLYAAAELTLDLAQALLKDHLSLKDGTPYNVLFRGPEPVFVDLLSFERRHPGDPTWLPYAQFLRTFLLPLAANKFFGLPLDQALMTRRDGLEPEEVYRWAGPLQRLRPPFLGLVSIPAWLSARHSPDDTTVYQRKLLENAEKADFILQSLFNRLRRQLHKLAPKGASSVWSTYMTVNNNYSTEHFEAKERFVGQALSECSPVSLLDVGCNTGHFSAMAARAGARVVSIDYDPAVVDEVWRRARGERLNILPLVVNLTRPTPGVGWRNRESASFLDRARGSFEAVLMLAVVHHMLVTERIPLDEILSQAAELTTRWLIIEFIGPEDSMFRRLTRGREELHRGLDHQVFESAAMRRFEIVRSQHTGNTHRWLYLLRKLPLKATVRP
jgi:2-polyprenyl-3-methyl-5-hydroxy-6-metoxy-1,4-benzoquinol methylase